MKYHAGLIRKLTDINAIEHGGLTQETKFILLKFIFVFNVFESEFFSSKKYKKFEGENRKRKICTSDRIRDLQLKLNEEKEYNTTIYEKYRQHFKKDYILEDGNYNERFNFNFNENINKEDIIDFLKTEKPRKEHFVQYLLEISYKFRNNLFHGNKDISCLEKYSEDFNVIQEFMCTLMQDIFDFGFEDF